MAEKKAETNMVEMGTMLFLAAVTVGVLLPGIGQVAKRQSQLENLEGCKANLVKIHEALDRYAINNEGRLPKTLGDLTPTIFESVPRCPEVNKPTYEDKGYKVKQGNPGRYTVFCFGSAHADVGMTLNQPYYDSLYGLKPSAGSKAEEK